MIWTSLADASAFALAALASFMPRPVFGHLTGAGAGAVISIGLFVGVMQARKEILDIKRTGIILILAF